MTHTHGSLVDLAHAIEEAEILKIEQGGDKPKGLCTIGKVSRG